MATKPGKPERRPSTRPQGPARPPPVPAPPRARPSEASAPEITLHNSPVGRETLAAIVSDLDEQRASEAAGEPASPMGAFRPEMPTLGYDQRPRVATPPPARGPLTSAPEVILVGDAPIGRATMAAIELELAESLLDATAPPAPAAATTVEPVELFEIATFVVKGGAIFSKASTEARREFVGRYLRRRLPVSSMEDVQRIDASPGAEPGSVILRVWCRLEPPAL